MRASLEGLPAELLLRIIESLTKRASPNRWSRAQELNLKLKLELHKALRATCTELNAKTLHYFGSTYFRKAEIVFTETKLLELRQLSRGQIGFYVQHVTLDFRTLFDQTIFVRDQSSDGDSEDSSSSDTMEEERPLQVGECRVRADLARFIEDGTCSRLLRKTLSNLRGLRHLKIRPPRIRGTMLAMDVEALQAFWLMTCKILLGAMLLGAVLPELPYLETLVYHSFGADILGLPLSFLKTDTAFPVSFSSLQQLRLFMVNDLNEDAFSQNVEAFASLLRKLTSLTHLRLALARAPISYFNRFASALPRMTLHTLKLVHTTVSFEALKVLLNTTAPTLRCFGLLRISFTTYEDFIQLLDLLITMQLENCSFQITDVGDQGLDFTEMDKMRPEEWPNIVPDACHHAKYDFCDWVQVEHRHSFDSILLSKEEDVDVGSWLRILSERVGLQEPFDCETLLLGPGV